MSSSIPTASWSPLSPEKAAKRSTDTYGRDSALATVLGAVGALALILTILLVWYFRRQTDPAKVQSSHVDLLKSRQSFFVDLEKAPTQQRYSTATTSDNSTSTVVSTETRAIIVTQPTPAIPVQTTSRQKISNVIRLPPLFQELSVTSPARASYAKTSANAMKPMSTTNAQTRFVRVPNSSNAAGSRFKIQNLTSDDISPSNPSVSKANQSSFALGEEQRIPSKIRSKSVKKPRPSNLIITRQTTLQVHSKGKATPNVPASPSQNEWSAGPVATPSTSGPGPRGSTPPPIPPFTELPFNLSPHVHLSRISTAPVSNEASDPIPSGIAH